ncbi:MAG: stage III sporulation protein AF [Clostridia bacterium]|nr:stage III sporulation protein AF [Clostridia bacterium]
MIENLSSWAEQIIVAVIIATLIEMILPSGNNKKYIKAVIGVYILFTIISPVFGTKIQFNEIDYESYFKNTESYQTMSDSLTSNNDQSVEEIYIANLKQDMKQKLKEKGYLAEKIAIRIELQEGENYGRVIEIDLTVSKMKEETSKENTSTNININTIDKISIGNTVTNTTNKTSRNKQNFF